MKTIVVPCDFSHPAIHAYRFALDVAARAGGVVHLLHVIELPELSDSQFDTVMSFENDHLASLGAAARKKMRHLPGTAGAGVSIIHTIRFGPIQTTLHQYVAEVEADVVIMGTHGASGLKEFFVGSNAEKVVRTAAVPVITLKAAHPDPIQRIVFPCTAEIETQEALARRVQALQRFFGASLHFVWIDAPYDATRDNSMQQRLETFAERLGFENYTVEVHHDTDIEAGITAYAARVHADMLALGTHGRRGLDHLFNGSMAEDLVNHAQYITWTSVMEIKEAVVAHDNK